MQPNFIFIGTDKSGSTWLYNLFLAADQVYVPDAKDIYFFDRFYEKGLDWYESFFHSSSNDLIYGEISHDYFFSNLACGRIFHHYPNVKILLFLRNPSDKILSHYHFLVRSGLTSKGFSDAIIDFPELIEKSLYSSHVEEVFNIFPRENIFVGFYDDLKFNSYSFAHEIFNFLEVDLPSNYDFSKIYLKSSSPRFFLLSKISKLSANLLRKFGFVNLLGKIKRNQFLLNLLFKDISINNDLYADDISNLYLKYFKNDISKLENILDMSLSHWRIK